MAKKIALALLSFLLLSAPATIAARDLTGTWSGNLKLGLRGSLKLVMHIAADSASLDSPDQNAYGIAAKLDYLSADSVNLSVAKLGMNFAGRLAGDSIVGQFRQGVMRLPLTLIPGAIKAKRPQTPVPPFPYSTETVTVAAPEALLAGTLTLPADYTPGATPAVVLVSGSGLQNRDEELFEHKPFAVIADFLARHGIASLRYDDRGCGESKGDARAATTADFAADAQAAGEYLRQSKRFGKVGLIGHSEGGMIGFMLGARKGMLDFVVAIAGPAVSGAEINAYQNKVALLAAGVDSITANRFEPALLRALKMRLANGPTAEVSDSLLAEIYPEHADSEMSRRLAENIRATLTLQEIKPWMEYFLRFDPTEAMQAIASPALLIYGEKDCQVPPSLNLAPAQTNAPGATVRCYPGLNHLMQTAPTGNINEYKEIEETISPTVLHDIATFITTLPH